MTVIYHIADVDDWTAARRLGVYMPDSLGMEGFIHASTKEQVIDTANRYYFDTYGLILLKIDTRRVSAEIKYEPSPIVPDELFPHIYGPLSADAVSGVFQFEPGPDGKFHGPVP